MKRFINLLVITTFLLIGAPGAAGKSAQAGALPLDSSSPAAKQAGMGEMMPAEDCGVPLNVPFGQDVEVFRGYTAGLRYDYNPAWRSSPISAAYGTPIFPVIGAAAVNPRTVAVVWKQGDATLYYTLWDGKWNSQQTLPPLPGSIDGGPAVLSSGGRGFEIYARVAGKIYTMAVISPTLMSAWSPLPNLTPIAAELSPQAALAEESPAASNPAIVAMSPQRILVFYRDQDGVVRLTERQGEVDECGSGKCAWRNTPLKLVDAFQQKVYLPLVGKQMLTGLQADKLADGTAAITTPQPSELVAVSRNEKHAAVLYVDAQNRLLVKEWTNQNESDWSDTRWQVLMNNVMIEKPAAGSLHFNHLAVAVRDTSGIPYLIEWTPNLNNTGQGGWKAPLSLGNVLDSPLALAITDIDSYTVFGADNNSTNASIWYKNWQKEDGWGDWASFGTFGGPLPPAMKILTPVVRIPDETMLLFRYGGENNTPVVVAQTYGSLGEIPVESVVAPGSGVRGYPRGQALAWVDSSTIWVTAHQQDNPGTSSFWQADAILLGSTWTAKQVLSAGNPFDPTRQVYAAVADLDQDGDDEAVFATDFRSPAGVYTNSLSVLDYTVVPVITSTVLASTNHVINSANTTLGFSMAVGDLDGDGVKNEVVLTNKTMQGREPIDIKIFQYNHATKSLELKAETQQALDLYTGNDPFPMSDFYYGSQVQVSAGYMYPQYPGQQILVSSYDFYALEFPLMGNYYRAFPVMHTYYVDTYGAEWAIKDVDNKLSASANDWNTLVIKYDATSHLDIDTSLNRYSAALDTADLDGDGYDEAALAYSNRVITVDPTAGSQRFKIAWFNQSRPERDFGRRSLAAGDINRDGQAEVISEMYVNASYPNKLNTFEIMGNGVLQQTNSFPLPTSPDRDSLHAILTGDIDNDSFTSSLTGCANYSDIRIIAVLNGAPRWYENGQPINSSKGAYSEDEFGSTSETTGMKLNMGTSFSIGFERDFTVPVIGTKIGEVRFSTTTDFMRSQGKRYGSEEYQSWGKNLGFSGLGLGEVVYEKVTSTCYFYDIYRPSAPEDKSRAMSCIPGAQDAEKTQATSLEIWRTPAGKAEAGLSWADVGHRAPNGSYSNDLSITGNYKSPVDEFMLLHKFSPFTVKNAGGLSVGWNYDKSFTGTFTKFTQMDTNITISAGMTLFGMSVDRSATFGVGTDSSESNSWGSGISFSGGIDQLTDNSRLCYTIVPYVYLAQAKTNAGVIYPYWEMDYYVTRIFNCYLQSAGMK